MVVLRCFFCFFSTDAQLTRILQILHGIFVDEHIPRGLQGMDMCLWIQLCAGNPVKHWCLLSPEFIGAPCVFAAGAATPGSNFEEALQKQLEVLKSELLQARGEIYIYIPSLKRTYPTLKKATSSTQKCRLVGDMLVCWRVYTVGWCLVMSRWARHGHFLTKWLANEQLVGGKALARYTYPLWIHGTNGIFTYMNGFVFVWW